MKNKLWFMIFFIFAHDQLVGFSQVYFTPRDDIKSYLIALIKEERLSIDAAVYMLTDKAIAQELVNAYIRGVKIRLVLDQISMGEKYGKGLFLQNSGIMVVVHRATSLNPFCMPIMHHKFFIFGFNARAHCSIAWTGSFNCTASASRLHDENVIMTDDAHVIADYKQCFAMLLQKLAGNRGMDFEEQSYG
ncbi:hypothetical protein A3J41_00380 [candidate division TM6 bacterium RIFCSPHIGHO2_12_FULL_38_8]|nr:MAG: hypothetical protein A3J41_00380 [candidate division TM6 bacterium RIFCSPHIGHO2_12_FULL_38_8]